MPRKKKPTSEQPSVTSGTDGQQAANEVIAAQPSKAAAATLSQYQKWEPVTIHRSKMKNAPYNPRKLDDNARKKLMNNIKRVGLIDPPIWNKTSGNLVGGHQRMKLMDALMGTNDYLLTVSQVEMDEKTEMEQNVFLNNQKVQGDWDSEKLEKLYKDYKIDVEATGFDTSDICKMYGDSVLIDQPEVLTQIAEKVRAAREQYDRTVVKNDDLDDPNFYLVVPFASYPERKLFTDALGVEDNRYLDGRFLASKLNISVEIKETTMYTAICDICEAKNDVMAGQTSVVCKKCKNPFSIETEEDTKTDAAEVVENAIGTGSAILT